MVDVAELWLSFNVGIRMDCCSTMSLFVAEIRLVVVVSFVVIIIVFVVAFAVMGCEWNGCSNP